MTERLPSNAFFPEGGTVVSRANVSSVEFDPIVGNNRASTQTTVSIISSVAVTKGAPPTADAGKNFSYLVVLENAGPSDAFGVVLLDDVPLPLRILSVDSACRQGTARQLQSKEGVQCEAPVCGEVGNNVVRCDVGNLTTTQRVTLSIEVAVDEAQRAVLLTNTAVVTTQSLDNDSERKRDSAVTSLFPLVSSCYPLVTLLLPYCFLLLPSCYPLVSSCYSLVTLLLTYCYPLVILLLPSCYPLVSFCFLLFPSCVSFFFPLSRQSR